MCSHPDFRVYPELGRTLLRLSDSLTHVRTRRFPVKRSRTHKRSPVMQAASNTMNGTSVVPPDYAAVIPENQQTEEGYQRPLVAYAREVPNNIQPTDQIQTGQYYAPNNYQETPPVAPPIFNVESVYWNDLQVNHSVQFSHMQAPMVPSSEAYHEMINYLGGVGAGPQPGMAVRG